MSLILEALRKSEAERRRGRAPDLHTELPPAHTRSKGMPAYWLWIAAAAALLLVVAIAWWQGRDTGAPAPQPDAFPATDAAPALRPRAENGSTAPAPVATFPRVERIVAPPAAPAPAKETASAPAPVAPDVDNASDVIERRGRDTDVPIRDDTDHLPASPTTTTPASTESADMPAPSQAVPPAASTSIARLTELPPAERKQLPAMKLSMHMWNERPAQRFVIIDGQRYIEGDRIGAATVRTIDSDGILLDLNGRQVRVPIR